jgi:hypothetical protein
MVWTRNKDFTFLSGVSFINSMFSILWRLNGRLAREKKYRINILKKTQKIQFANSHFYDWLIVCCLTSSGKYFMYMYKQDKNEFNNIIKLYRKMEGMGKLIQFRPFGLRTPKTFKIIWLSSLSTLSIPDEGYSRNVSCALNLISTFSLLMLRYTRYKFTWSSLSVTWCRLDVFSLSLVFSTNKNDHNDITQLNQRFFSHHINSCITLIANILLTIKIQHNMVAKFCSCKKRAKKSQ